MTDDLSELARKMDALNLWDRLYAYNWAVKLRGTVFPYFCFLLKGENPLIKLRFLMLEGWQTLHEFVKARSDPNAGVYSLPVELPHYELILLPTGAAKLFRYDTGFVPVEVEDAKTAIPRRILWEAFGLLMRLESDPKLLLRYVDEQAIFGRVETAKGEFEDAPLPIPDPSPYRESISFAKDDLKRAKDLPLVTGEALHLDFRILQNVMTNDRPRARAVYQLLGYDPQTKKSVIDLRASIQGEGTLKGLWETMPSQVLKALIATGRIPGEIKVRSGRVFRFIRVLGIDLPIKFSLHDSLEGL